MHFTLFKYIFLYIYIISSLLLFYLIALRLYIYKQESMLKLFGKLNCLHNINVVITPVTPYVISQLNIVNIYVEQHFWVQKYTKPGKLIEFIQESNAFKLQLKFSVCFLFIAYALQCYGCWTVNCFSVPCILSPSPFLCFIVIYLGCNYILP